MRTAFGWVVFFGGVLGLCFWASDQHAVSIENTVRTAAASAAGDRFSSIVVSVSGRDISVSGEVASESARQDLLARMADVEGHRLIHDYVELANNN